MALRVGPDLKPYYVSEVLLESLKDLPRSREVESTIDLSDVNGDTAHTIVHFLYTGQYQTLPNGERETPTGASKGEFKKAIATFIAAKSYGLTNLLEVARLEAERIGDDISIVQVAHAVGKETLTSMHEDAGWLQGLVLRKAEQTFTESDEIFSTASFFNGIKNLKLAKLLGQRNAELYRRRVRQLRDQSNPFDARRAEHEVDKVIEPIGYEPDEAGVGDTHPACHGSETNKEAAPELTASETLSQSHCAAIEIVTQPEPEHLALEEHVSDTYAAVAEPEIETIHRAEDTSGISEPSSTGIGVDEWQVVMDTVVKQPETIAPEMENPLRVHYRAGTGPFEGMKSNKEKLRLRKKLEAQAASRFSAGKGGLTVDKMKEELKTLDTGTKEEIAAKMQAVSVEETPCNETEREISATHAPAIDPFAGSSRTQRKRLEQKLKEEAAAKEEQGGVCAAQDVATGSNLIEPGADSAVSIDAPDDEICPSRHEHLKQNEEWRNCWKCEAYMRKIAIKLHTVGLPDVNSLLIM